MSGGGYFPARAVYFNEGGGGCNWRFPCPSLCLNHNAIDWLWERVIQPWETNPREADWVWRGTRPRHGIRGLRSSYHYQQTLAVKVKSGRFSSSSFTCMLHQHHKNYQLWKQFTSRAACNTHTHTHTQIRLLFLTAIALTSASLWRQIWRTLKEGLDQSLQRKVEVVSKNKTKSQTLLTCMKTRVVFQIGRARDGLESRVRCRSRPHTCMIYGFWLSDTLWVWGLLSCSLKSLWRGQSQRGCVYNLFLAHCEGLWMESWRFWCRVVAQVTLLL